MADRNRILWQRAGFIENGATLEALGANDVIWVPPAVSLAVRPSHARRRNINEDALTLVYPIPDHWQPPVTEVDWAALVASGWTKRDNTSGVLEAFLRLAREDLNGRELDEVRAFATHWGPLWVCRRHRDCFWTNAAVVYRGEGPCTWAPQEAFGEFLRQAWRAKLVLEAAALLQEDRPVPATVWRQLGFTAPRGIDAQKFWLAAIVCASLHMIGGPRLWMVWNGERPHLQLVTGLGCIRAVWLQIAQILCQAKGLYRCDACGTFYVRSGRKPQAGRRNYCPDCGTERGNRADKRWWWANKQGKVIAQRQPRRGGG